MTSIALDWKGIGSIALLDAGVTRDSRGVVHIPYRLEDGATWRERCFAANGRQWWGPPRDAAIIPFGLETIPPGEAARGHVLLVAEGESDTLSLRETYAEMFGYPVCVVGIPGAGMWRSEWAKRTRWFGMVYLLSDGDEAGRRMTNRILRDMPWARPVVLPAGEDARSLIQAGRVDELTSCIYEARETAILFAAIKHSPRLCDFHRWFEEASDGPA
jgi:hypothetical protein